MNTLIIDGRRCKTKAQTFAYLAKKIPFPDYFGGNLDALYDILTAYQEQTCFRIRFSKSIQTNLGNWGEMLIQLFADSASANKNIVVEIN